MTDDRDLPRGRDTSDMPVRLRVAAQAIVDAERARYGVERIDLAMLDALGFEHAVDRARAALDAADAAELSIEPQFGITAAAIERMVQAKAAALALRSQGVVLLDIQQDGTVRLSTWTQASGTPAEALAEWARGLGEHGLSVVPFRTVFGWGEDGVPTPLTPEELASLSEAGRVYADRNSEEPRS